MGQGRQRTDVGRAGYTRAVGGRRGTAGSLRLRRALLGALLMLAAATPAATSAAASAPPAPPAAASEAPPALAQPARPGVDTVFLSLRQLTGYVGLYALGPAGASIEIAEQLPDGDHPLASGTLDSTGRFVLPRAVTWSCENLTRHFAASVTALDGTRRAYVTDIRTPSCARRLTLRVPTHVDRGKPVQATIVDRWGLGDRIAQLCFSGTGVGHACQDVPLTPGRAGVSRSVTPDRDGLLRVAVGLLGKRSTAAIAVGRTRPVPATFGPLMLTTGDSTIDGIDSVLDERYGTAVRVRADARPGTQLSGTGGDVDWYEHANQQVKKLHPRVTVVSLGGNEGFSIPVGRRSVECCTAAWSAALAARQRQLMNIYRQGGKAEVVWLLIPKPSGDKRAAIIDAANAAVRIAAKGLSNVTVIDLGSTFTPDGRFHSQIIYGGQPVTVRSEDGLHLTAAGQEIAADLVRDVVDRDDLLAPPG